MASRYKFCETPRTIEITATQRIAVGKILLVGASITALAANCTAVFYDGADIAGTIVNRLSVVPNMTICGSFDHGILFEHGLFAVLAGANVAVTVSYYPIYEEREEDGLKGSD